MAQSNADGAQQPAATMDSRITKKMLQALAPLPDTAMRLLALLDDPDIPLREIANVAVRDVGISATMLRMANSSMFGLRGRVGSISDALRVVGTAQARLLILASGISQTAQRELPLYNMAAGAFMRHSELVANIAMYVSHEWGYSNIGIAYSAGLLHDIGKIVINGLTATGPGHHTQLERTMREYSCDVQEAERILCGGDHAQIGSQLIELWSLPTEIQNAIALHHSGANLPVAHSLERAVIVANYVAGQIDPLYPTLNRSTDEIPESLIDIEKVIVASSRFVDDVARSA